MCTIFVKTKTPMYRWREAATETLLSMYYRKNSFYYIQKYKSIDNPGQRICMNMDDWSWGTLNFAVQIVRQILSAIAWFFVLFQTAAGMLPPVFALATVFVVVTVTFFLAKLTSIHLIISQVR